MSPDDGWGAHEGVVTGGAAATAGQIYRVRNRAQLAAALRGGGTQLASSMPKIIYVEGSIDLSVDDSNRPLVEADYRDAAFTWDAYAHVYDVATWGRKPPAGALEDARKRSADRQAAVVVMHVGSNTTLIGVGRDALIRNGGLLVRDAQNVVIRNLNFEDAYDYFPAWDPNDDVHGQWNAAYDNVTLYNARRIWIDQCTFSDGPRPDRVNRSLLGRPMQFHDGLLDVVRGSDLVTVSNSHFRNHDKGLLIGNSDSRSDDDGKLRVTLQGNWFENVRERSPRVRYGRVHLYNNLYSATPGADYAHSYSIGAGFKSRVIAENNMFDLGNRAAVTVFKWWKADRFESRNNRMKGSAADHDLDATSALERQAGTPIAREAGWLVPYRYSLLPPDRVEAAARSKAGAGRRE